MKNIDFNFVRDESIRNIIIRDYNELQQLLENNISKSTIVISGGILESLLADALLSLNEIYFEKGYIHNQQTKKRLNLAAIVKLANEKHILNNENLPHTIRDFRNLVHIGKEIHENTQIDLDEAKFSFHAINKIINDLRKWYCKAIPLLSASEIEINFLELFTLPEPTNLDYSNIRPWIKNEVFNTWRTLDSKNIVIAQELNDSITKFKFDLSSGVIELIERITGKQVMRNSIIIALREVFANNASGSGAIGSTKR
ncbi:MAG TPA: hypothetical protein PKY59_18175 [Pyrinomonadaceae bacterium]|nr:hypothetical protein [Pyrinomonadaceae bacterium]